MLCESRRPTKHRRGAQNAIEGSRAECQTPGLRQETFAGSDNVEITVAVSRAELIIRYRPSKPADGPQNIFVALGTHQEIGAAVLPFSQHREGSTVFLPFKCDLFLSVESRPEGIACFLRRWERWRWSEQEETEAFKVAREKDEFVFRLPCPPLGELPNVDFVIYAKDPAANDGWGWFWGCSDHSVRAGIGDKYIPHYHELRLDGPVIPSEVEGPVANRSTCNGVLRLRFAPLRMTA